MPHLTVRSRPVVFDLTGALQYHAGRRSGFASCPLGVRLTHVPAHASTPPTLQRFVRNVALLLGTDLAMSAVTFAINIFVIRAIGPAGNGAASLVVSIASALSIPMLFGLHAATTQAIASGTPVATVVGTVFSTLAVTAPVFGLMAVLASVPLGDALGVAPSLVVWAAAFAVVQSMHVLAVGVLNGLHEFPRVARANGLSTAAYALVLLGVLASRIPLGFELFVLASMLRTALYFAALVPTVWAHAAPGDRLMAARLIRFGGYYAASAAAYTLALGTIDTLMLNAFHGASVVGIYAAYYMPFNLVVSRALKAVADVWMPTMAARGDSLAQAPRVMRALAVWGLPIVPGSIVVSRVLFALLGDQYEFDWTAAALVGVCLHLHIAVSMLSELQVSSGVHGARAAFVAAIGTAVVNVVANVLLIPSFAIVGCLLATMLASLTSLGLRVAWFGRARAAHQSAASPVEPAVPE